MVSLNEKMSSSNEMDDRVFVGTKHQSEFRYRRPNKKLKITLVLQLPASYTIQTETDSESGRIGLIDNICTKPNKNVENTVLLPFYIDLSISS